MGLENMIGNRQRKIYIVGRGNPQYRRMWEDSGFAITNNIADADIVNFTGGEDVTPALYNESPLFGTMFNVHRDNQETEIYKAALNLNKFMVGICRGGQFLNVMNGGKMWQDVDNHGKSHLAKDIASGKDYWVTSTHHQMMRPTPDAIVLMTAKESKEKLAMKELWRHPDPGENDIEAVFYPQTRSLCFQPHPEFSNAGDCRRAFMKYVRECFLDETYRRSA